MSTSVAVVTDVLASATKDLAGIGSNVAAGGAAAAERTTAVLATGADEVSAAIAALFSGYGREYVAVSAQANAFHQQSVSTLTGSVLSPAASEAANATPL